MLKQVLEQKQANQKMVELFLNLTKKLPTSAKRKESGWKVRIRCLLK
jgi:hypothetical protein